MGQRDAVSRLAHLILEIYTRLATIGRVKDLSFEFPATQAIFAEAIGTSPVHLNRVVQELRKRELLEFERGQITILDKDGLRELSGFDPLYLHLDPALRLVSIFDVRDDFQYCDDNVGSDLRRRRDGLT